MNQHQNDSMYEEKVSSIKRYMQDFRSSAYTTRKVLDEAEKRGLYKVNRKSIIIEKVAF